MTDQVSKADGNTQKTLIGLTTDATPQIRNIATDADGRLLTATSTAAGSDIVALSTSTLNPVFTSTASVVGLTTTSVVGISTAANTVQTTSIVPSSGNILIGSQSFATVTAATTIITIPAGRTWQGVIGVACVCTSAAGSTSAAGARGLVTYAGAALNPSTGQLMACAAFTGAGVATGLTAENSQNAIAFPFTLAATSTGAALVQVAQPVGAGAVADTDFTASGVLL